MSSLDNDIRQLQRLLTGGSIQRAYKGIISYMSRLQTEFINQRGKHSISGLYQGYFDMTYFALFSDELKERNLKLAVVFNYETFGFEVWLAARNRKIQRQYWELFLNTDYKNHQLVEPAVGVDAIVMAEITANYSLEDEDSLTLLIVNGVANFERDIMLFLSRKDVRKNG